MTTTTDHTDAHRAPVIADIRALADFLDAHPDVDMPATFDGHRHIFERGEFARAARALGDDATLEVRNGYAIVTLQFGAAVTLGIQTYAAEILGEQPLQGQTERVRRALDDLVGVEGASVDG
jgi:thioredoxin-like negative regulator of GroEL